MAVPQKSSSPVGGIFQYLVSLQGTPAQVEAAKAKLAMLTPETMAVYAVLNLLPEGGLKSWLTANPVQFWTKIWQVIVGRKWTTGDYRLAERLNDQVYCNGNIGYRQASDDMVEVAHTIFNQLFGVRINNDDDLGALDAGFDAYKARFVSAGISDDAIERAVFLKQNYYPASTYNNQCWDLRYFEIYPLVARIPDFELNKWYTGPVIGGVNAVDGLIPISATDVLDQYEGADFDPVTGNVTTADGTVITPGETVAAQTGSLLDQIMAKIKARDPMTIAITAGLAYYLYTELEDEL